MNSVKKYGILSLLASSLISQMAMATPSLTEDTFVTESSYAMGVLLGQNMEQVIDSQNNLIKLDRNEVVQGIHDVLTGKNRLSEAELQQQLKALSQKMLQLQQQKDQATLAEGEKFRLEYKQKNKAKETLSGLLYRIEEQGDGDPVKLGDTVKVHYKGTLIDGTVFDNSYERGQPIEFTLNKGELIAGWIEGISLIQKGGKIELVLPPNLAYGHQAVGKIPANSTLVFTIELIDVTPNNSK